MPALHAITVDRLARIIGTPNAPIVIDLGPDTVRNTLPAVLSRSVATMPERAGSIAGRSAIVICEDGGAASQGRYRSATPGGRECHRQRQAGSHERSHRSLPGTCRGRRRAAARDRSVSSNLKILVTLGFSIKIQTGPRPCTAGHGLSVRRSF
jgi:hypothetical protein